MKRAAGFTLIELLDEVDPFANPIKPNNPGGGPYIGDEPGYGRPVAGIIDDLRIYDEGLPVSLINHAYIAGLPSHSLALRP